MGAINAKLKLHLSRIEGHCTQKRRFAHADSATQTSDGSSLSGFAAARRAQRMLARFKHCLLVSRVESPHIACSLSGDLRSVTVPRVPSHTSVRDRRELTKLSPRNRRTECPPR